MIVIMDESYTPTERDILFAKGIVSSVAQDGLWTACGSCFSMDHHNKSVTLTAPSKIIDGQMWKLCRLASVFNAIGYRLEIEEVSRLRTRQSSPSRQEDASSQDAPTLDLFGIFEEPPAPSNPS